MSSILLVTPDRAQQAATVERWGMVNWSAAFVAVLEKRGWLSVDVRTLADLKGAADISDYDLVILAWHGGGGPTVEQAQWFAAANLPMLIEGPASPALLQCFGLAAGADVIPLQESPNLDLADKDLRAELGRRCPATLGPDPQQIRLDEKVVALAEKEFDFVGARFKALSVPRASEAAANMLISLLPVLSRRFERQDSLFEDAAIDLEMAYSLQLVEAHLGRGRHDERARAFIQKAVQAARSRRGDQPVAEDDRNRLKLLRTRLNGVPPDPESPDESRTRRNAARLLKTLETSPSEDLESVIIRTFPRIRIANLLLAVAHLPKPALRDRLFLYLRDRFYDARLGGFRPIAIVDGAFQSGEGIVTHPDIVKVLAVISGPITMPHYGQMARDHFTDQQLKAWGRAPLVHCKLHGEDWDVLASLTGGDPAMLQRGATIVTSLPLLAWITHYHTIGPLQEAFKAAPQKGFMGIEELLVLCLERLARLAQRPVPRIAPWPWGYDFVLNVRHDVDRIPDEATFERLMQFHRNEDLGVTWYWLPWRLDRRKMLVQLEAGHEIALHSVRSLEKNQEREAIALECGAKVVGEAYHGAAADYWLGAPSVAESNRAGLSYTQFAPNMYLFPYAAYPWLESDGSVALRRGSIGITQNTSTDRESPDDVQYDLDENLSLNSEWASRGLAIVLLNHPDINFEYLRRLVGALPSAGRLNWTARQIADWWRRTHQVGHLTWNWDGDALVVTSTEDIADLALILPATERAIEVDGEAARDARVGHGRDGEVRLCLSLKAGVPVRIILMQPCAL